MILVVAATDVELHGLANMGATGVETLVCGIGPVDAAARVAARLASGPRIATVLQVGIAGARPGSGIGIGSLVVGASALYEDVDANLVVREATPDPVLVERLVAALPGVAAHPIGTSARVGGTRVSPVEAMEGFGVLRAAGLAGVSAVELRAISNEIDEPDRTRWQFARALDALTEALPAAIAALA